MIERTLSIIKPDAVRRKLIGNIYSRLEEEGFSILIAQLLSLTVEQARIFYDEHKERPFFNNLVTFMSSGPVMVQVLEAPNVVAAYREVMGHTDPKQAGHRTLRAQYGTSMDCNVVHGSDSLESAAREIHFFFAERDF